METFSNNEIVSALWLYRSVVITVISMMALVFAVKVWWDKVKYFFMNMKYGFPVIGKIAKARKGSEKQKENGWFPCEETLCDDFYSYYGKDNKNPEFYEKCRDYLNKCQETGRREKGFLLSILLFFLILFEAVGFAYILMPWMNNNVSANVATMSAWIAASFLAVLGLGFTHFFGKEIHANSLIKKIRTWYENDRDNPQNIGENKKVDIVDTYKDDDQKSYVQMVNRVKTNDTVTPSYTLAFCTISYILVIAIGAFMVRSYALDSIEAEAVNTASPFISSSFSPSSSPFELPAEAEVFNQSADKKTGDDKKSAVHMASLTTYVILSVVFVGVQVIGIMFGYLYSFSGVQSKDAWKYTKDFNNSEEFANYYQRQRDQVARDAQAKLSALQESLSSRVTTSGYEREAILRGGHKTFDIYLQNKEKERKVKLARETKLNQSETSRQQLDTHSLEETDRVDNKLQEDQVKKSEVTNLANSVSAISNIGDITDLDDQDLAMLAEELGVELEQLQRKKRMQLFIAKQKAV